MQEDTPWTNKKSQKTTLQFFFSKRLCTWTDEIFFLISFFQKSSNLHERFRMCWNEWKIYFLNFIFWVMVFFLYSSFRWIFTITRKIKIWKLFFSFDSAHCASFMKVGSKLRGGVCISLVGKKPIIHKNILVFICIIIY